VHNTICAALNLNWVYDGVTTGKIYARAYKMFHKRSGNKASRYKLKIPLSSMGPTGYPFEHLIGELFRRQGFEFDGVQIFPRSGKQVKRTCPLIRAFACKRYC